MSAYILSNALVYLKDILPITAGVGATFRISPDLERGLDINTGGVNAFFILKSSTQIERYLITAVGGVATIVKRGLEQDGITENANLKKSWGDGSVGYITVKPDDFIALGKLDTAGGLRNTMGTAQNIGATNGSTAITVADTTGWENGVTITGNGIPGGTTIVSFVPNTSAVLSANFTGTTGTVSVTVGIKYALEINSSLNEVKRPIISGTPSGSDLLQSIDPTTRAIKEFPFSQVASIGDSYIVGEAISANDAIATESYYHPMMCDSQISFGNALATQWTGFRMVGNGKAMTSILMGLKKVGSPVDNCVISIQADVAGAPSGTDLVSVTRAGGTLTTSTAEYANTITSTTLTDKVPYWVIFKRSGSLDVANYYQIAVHTDDTISFPYKINNNGTWGGNLLTESPSIYGNGFYGVLAVKARANNSKYCNIVGYSSSVRTIYQEIICKDGVLNTGFSGLIAGREYFLSNTPGAISLTPGTIHIPAGVANTQDSIKFNDSFTTQLLTISGASAVYSVDTYTGPVYIPKGGMAYAVCTTGGAAGVGYLQSFINGAWVDQFSLGSGTNLMRGFKGQWVRARLNPTGGNMSGGTLDITLYPR